MTKFYRGITKDENTPALTYYAEREGAPDTQRWSVFSEYVHGDWYPHPLRIDSALTPSREEYKQGLDYRCQKQFANGEIVLLPNPDLDGTPPGMPVLQRRKGKGPPLEGVFVSRVKVITYENPLMERVGAHNVPTFSVLSRLAYATRSKPSVPWYLITHTRMCLHEGVLYGTLVGTRLHQRTMNVNAAYQYYALVGDNIRKANGPVNDADSAAVSDGLERVDESIELSGDETMIKQQIIEVISNADQRRIDAKGEAANAMQQEFNRLRAINRDVLTDMEYAERMRLQRALQALGKL